MTVTSADPSVHFLDAMSGSMTHFTIDLPILPISPDETWAVSLSSLSIALSAQGDQNSITPLSVHISLCDSDRFGVTSARDTLYVVSASLLPNAPIANGTLVYLAPRDSAQPQWVKVSDDAATERKLTFAVRNVLPYPPGNPQNGKIYFGGERTNRNTTILNLAFMRTGLKR